MKTSYWKSALACSAVVLLSACNVLPEPSETRVYPLPVSSQLTAVAPTYQGSLRVNQPRSLQSLDTPRLSVIREDGRQAYWQDVRLQDRLPLVLQASLAQGLSQMQVARHVVTDDVGANYDVTLTTTIERFAIVEGETWQAQVALRVQLQNGRDRQVVASTTLNASRNLNGRDISSAFAALSDANAQVQQALADWIVSELEK